MLAGLNSTSSQQPGATSPGHNGAAGGVPQYPVLAQLLQALAQLLQALAHQNSSASFMGARAVQSADAHTCPPDPATSSMGRGMGSQPHAADSGSGAADVLGFRQHSLPNAEAPSLDMRLQSCCLDEAGAAHNVPAVASSSEADALYKFLLMTALRLAPAEGGGRGRLGVMQAAGTEDAMLRAAAILCPPAQQQPALYPTSTRTVSNSPQPPDSLPAAPHAPIHSVGASEGTKSVSELALLLAHAIAASGSSSTVSPVENLENVFKFHNGGHQ